MGLYDRDYLREDDDRRGIGLGGERSMVTNLIIVNVALFLADVLFQGQLSQWFSLKSDVLWHPWNLWQLLTYGFFHSTQDVRHIAFNMIGLYFFGRALEPVYGRREFLLTYLAFIIFGGATWLAVQNVTPHGNDFFGPRDLIGASAGVTGVTTLFVLNYPFRTILLFGILPMPAWLLGVLFVAQDLIGATGGGGVQLVAFEAHLGGALLAFLYWRFRWRFERWVPADWSKFRFRASRLRIHRPAPTEQDMQQRVDKILAKWSEKGEQSLTREERKTLEDASRRYRNRSDA